jgi:PST family polysaccharide transporter
LGAIHLVRLQKELEFRRKLVPDLARSLFKGIVSISLALAGFGVWSLVIGQLAGVVAGVILSWVVFPWLPRLTIDTKLVKSLLRYGFSIVGVDTMAIATDNFDYLIIGRLLGSASLGIYTLAYRLPELLVLNPLWVMASALFPAYAKIQQDRDALRQGFLVTMRFIAFVCVPLSLGLALVADPLVRVVFGEQWLEAIPIVSILAIFVLVRSIGFNAGDVYKAVGRPDILVKLEVLNFIVLVPALLAGAYFGLVGIALGHLLAGLVRMIADLITASRFIEINFKDILLQLKPSFMAGLVLIAFTVSGLYLTTNTIPLFQLITAMVMGAIGYLSLLWLLERDSLLKMSRIVGLPV